MTATITPTPKSSPFLHPNPTSSTSSLAILHLRRDQLLPIFLNSSAPSQTSTSGKPSSTSSKALDKKNEGYEAGMVVNTRFGSFPHSTLIGLPWGSQVLASKVDTGSRGRPGKGKRGIGEVEGGIGVREGGGDGGRVKKQKVEGVEDVDFVMHGDVDEEGKSRNGFVGDKDTATTASSTTYSIPTSKIQQAQVKIKAPVLAASGFLHLLPPTPETWTISLPHRTQVVYTPDYSYILQRLKVRPGSVVIEAGAGSGSFTHAAVRGVFSGYPGMRDVSRSEVEADQKDGDGEVKKGPEKKEDEYGRVYSFEYHGPRAETLQEEIESHSLASLVTVTHRDVYEDGFLVPDLTATPSPSTHPSTSTTTATQSKTPPTTTQPETTRRITNPLTSPHATAIFLDLPAPWLALPHLTRSTPSPLNPHKPTHICAFLPCLEQAQRTISFLRTHGWQDIDMRALSHRRLDVRRERIGLDLEGQRGVNAVPIDVEEAVGRLKEVEWNSNRRREFTITAATRGNLNAGTNASPKFKPKPTENIIERIIHHSSSSPSEAKDGEVSIAAMTHQPPPHPSSKTARLQRLHLAAQTRKPYLEGRLVHRTEPDIKTHTSYLVFAVLPVEWSQEEEEKCRVRWPPERTNWGPEDGKGKAGKRKRGGEP